MKRKILIIDDDTSMCNMLRDFLARREYDVQTSPDAELALEILRSVEVDVVLTDVHLTGMSGLELCRRITETRSDLPIVVITAFGSLESAIAAIRAGAYDFVTKPVDLELLAISLRRALDYRNLQDKVALLRRALDEKRDYEELIGESDPMKRLFALLDRAAATDASVLVTGESGTGKELVARALHARGRRSRRPFMALNCAALPETLLESELFGYKKGAFTDAKSDRSGLFIAASGGTLFLDEIAEMPLTLQPKLLRALQERSIRPIGSTSEESIDVRIIAASNASMERKVAEHLFREDLYYRLNVIQIVVPPLRQRGVDILILANRFVEEIATRYRKSLRGISKPASRLLLNYRWPGNVRELRNAMERAVALTSHDLIQNEDLPDIVQSSQLSREDVSGTCSERLVSLAEMERQYIQQVLAATNGNHSRAAMILGLDRKTLYRKTRPLDHDPSVKPSDP